MDTNEDDKHRSRRRHANELKRQVLAECAVPGASVAMVAMAHGLNANLVHKWRRALQTPSRAAATFVPAGAPAVVNESPQHIELELHRGTLSVRVRWPMSGAGGCAVWLREILR